MLYLLSICGVPFMTNYLITGGGFNNKGAESMLYTLLT